LAKENAHFFHFFGQYRKKHTYFPVFQNNIAFSKQTKAYQNEPNNRLSAKNGPKIWNLQNIFLLL
jgi:hypothetical protein